MAPQEVREGALAHALAELLAGIDDRVSLRSRGSHPRRCYSRRRWLASQSPAGRQRPAHHRQRRHPLLHFRWSERVPHRLLVTLGHLGPHQRIRSTNPDAPRLRHAASARIPLSSTRRSMAAHCRSHDAPAVRGSRSTLTSQGHICSRTHDHRLQRPVTRQCSAPSLWFLRPVLR